MAYTLIRGDFHIINPERPRQGPEPDGDTLKFQPDNPALIETLTQPGRAPGFNRMGQINLRFEGIDALETHYSQMHQNMEFALGARDAMLAMAGFGAVKFWDDLPAKVETVENHPRPGYVLTRTLDTHGRIISFVFPGDPPEMDGAQVFLDEDRLDQSFNAALVRDGWAYPAFYTTLPISLKDRLAAHTGEARQAGRGLWPHAEATATDPATVPDLATLETLVIWPKLFRRLARFFAQGNQQLSGFETWLRADPVNRDDRLILPNMELGNMHDLIEVEGNELRMLHPPEAVIILPDDANVVFPMPAPPPPPPPFVRGTVRIIAALANPVGPEAGHESVTLLNTAPEAVALDGWVLRDRANGREPLSGTLDAGDARRVTLSNRLRLNNNGDTISLFDPDGTQVDLVSYTAEEAKKEGYTLVF